MVAEGVTVPHLMGAATHVSTVGEYVGVFKRVFSALGITDIVESELRTTASEVEIYGADADNNLYNVLADLFETRNRLVHEIDMSIVGPFSFRDAWEPERAAKYGKAVVAAIKLVEAKITQHSPEDFPNRLGPDGLAEDELEKLKLGIVTVQSELSALFATDDDEEFQTSWRRALDAGTSSQAQELGFLEGAQFLRPLRHLDARRSVQIEYLKARLTYLLSLKAEAEQSYKHTPNRETT